MTPPCVRASPPPLPQHLLPVALVDGVIRVPRAVELLSEEAAEKKRGCARLTSERERDTHYKAEAVL